MIALDRDTYRASRVKFNTYAGMDGTCEPFTVDQLSALQVQLARWETRNFGYQPAWTAALGIVEEIGELLAARNASEVEDGIGDVMIFATQLCTAYRLDFGVLLTARLAVPDAMHALTIAAGFISRCILKEQQKIRDSLTQEACRERIAFGVYALICALSTAFPLRDLPSIYAGVAVGVVLKRDWARFPLDGVTQ